MFNSILHYQYDQQNRYKGAYAILNNAMMDYYYTESFTYDLQGNIKTLESCVYSLDEPISEGLTAARGNPFTVTTIRKNK